MNVNCTYRFSDYRSAYNNRGMLIWGVRRRKLSCILFKLRAFYGVEAEDQLSCLALFYTKKSTPAPSLIILGEPTCLCTMNMINAVFPNCLGSNISCLKPAFICSWLAIQRFVIQLFCHTGTPQETYDDTTIIFFFRNYLQV